MRNCAAHSRRQLARAALFWIANRIAGQGLSHGLGRTELHFAPDSRSADAGGEVQLWPCCASRSARLARSTLAKVRRRTARIHPQLAQLLRMRRWKADLSADEAAEITVPHVAAGPLGPRGSEAGIIVAFQHVPSSRAGWRKSNAVCPSSVTLRALRGDAPFPSQRPLNGGLEGFPRILRGGLLEPVPPADLGSRLSKRTRTLDSQSSERRRGQPVVNGRIPTFRSHQTPENPTYSRLADTLAPPVN